MPVLPDDGVEVLEGADAPEPTSEDFKLRESVSLSERDPAEAAALVEAFVEDGDRATQLAEAVRAERAVVLDLIRPCVGRGRGKHLYKAEMLEANASKFTGWKMYLNHLSEQARRALGGLPRDVRDLGGIVQESWWNPDVPAEGRFGKGAVQGVSTPVPLIQELVKVDPRLVETSINATATACKPGRTGSERVWIVEGIEDKGSVDWVTDGGAGGRVASIMEALIDDGSAVTGALDSLDNGTILAWIEQHRPDLLEAMSKGDGDGNDGEPDEDDDLEAAVKKLLKSGKAKTRAQALALAKQAMKVKQSQESSDDGGDEVPDLTPEVLAEALASDEAQAVLAEAIAPAVVEAVRSLDLGAEVVNVVEARLETDREVIRAEAEARADRRNELRDMRDRAHRKIDESRLHPRLKTQVKARFDLVEGVPTSDLNLIDDEDEDGKVVKRATEKLDEAVTEEIRAGLSLMAELNPTRVRDQGPTKLSEGTGDGKGKGDGKGEGEADKGSALPAAKELLESLGMDAKPEEVFARSL